MKVEQTALKSEQYYIKLRHLLHQNAECGFSLDQTRRIVTDELRALGIEYKSVGEGSLAARIGRGDFGVLLRADMDALFMKEEAELPFASSNGCMHACGHDMHTAMLLFAAKLLKQEESGLAHEVRILFQAAEESLCGARDAIECGILQEWEEIEEKNEENNEKCKAGFTNCTKNCFVKAAYSLHVLVGIPIDFGTIIVPDGGIGAPASDFFRICVKGQSSHGAVPHQGTDALLSLGAICSSLSTLATRYAPITDAPLITVGKVTGGENANVICSHAIAEGTVRSLDDGTQQRLRWQMRESVRCIAEAYGTRAELSFFGSAPTLRNDAALSALALSLLGKQMQGVLSSATFAGTGARGRLGGSEDFASFSHIIPSLLLGICAGDSREGYIHPLHHPGARFDESAIMRGALAYFRLGMAAVPYRRDGV